MFWGAAEVIVGSGQALTALYGFRIGSLESLLREATTANLRSRLIGYAIYSFQLATMHFGRMPYSALASSPRNFVALFHREFIEAL